MENKKYGLSGYLAPDGVYYECGYGDHQEMAEYLVEKYKVNSPDIDFKLNHNHIALYGDFLKFGCAPWLSDKEGDHMCHVFLSVETPITEEQYIWLKENWGRMSYKQSLSLIRSLVARNSEYSDNLVENHKELKRVINKLESDAIGE